MCVCVCVDQVQTEYSQAGSKKKWRHFSAGIIPRPPLGIPRGQMPLDPAAAHVDAHMCLCVCVLPTQETRFSFQSSNASTKSCLCWATVCSPLSVPLSQQQQRESKSANRSECRQKGEAKDTAAVCMRVRVQGAKIHPKLPEPHTHKQQQFIYSLSLSLSADAHSLT